MNNDGFTTKNSTETLDSILKICRDSLSGIVEEMFLIRDLHEWR